ncbi:MAG: hypothetical protein AAB774_00100 [Patescibacteria group bacterium]
MVKDGNLPINVSVPTASSSIANAVPPVVVAPETPIIVTESEVASSTENTPDLAEEVESLSGEIQALEAKIDRLTGNVKPVVEPPKANDKANELSTTELPPPPITPPSPPPSPIAPANKPESKTASINDIYAKQGMLGKSLTSDNSKVGQRQKEASVPPKSDSDDAEDVGSGSSIGTIGEVLAVFGVIIFVAMAAFPFYKSLMSESVTEAIRSIGWPTAVVSLALGFLMSLFNHGKVATKILTVIVLLLATILYLGVAGFQNYLGPLGPMLDSVFTFYR